MKTLSSCGVRPPVCIDKVVIIIIDQEKTLLGPATIPWNAASSGTVWIQQGRIVRNVVAKINNFCSIFTLTRFQISSVWYVMSLKLHLICIDRYVPPMYFVTILFSWFASSQLCQDSRVVEQCWLCLRQHDCWYVQSSPTRLRLLVVVRNTSVSPSVRWLSPSTPASQLNVQTVHCVHSQFGLYSPLQHFDISHKITPPVNWCWIWFARRIWWIQYVGVFSFNSVQCCHCTHHRSDLLQPPKHCPTQPSNYCSTEHFLHCKQQQKADNWFKEARVGFSLRIEWDHLVAKLF